MSELLGEVVGAFCEAMLATSPKLALAIFVVLLVLALIGFIVYGVCY